MTEGKLLVIIYMMLFGSYIVHISYEGESVCMFYFVLINSKLDVDEVHRDVYKKLEWDVRYLNCKSVKICYWPIKQRFKVQLMWGVRKNYRISSFKIRIQIKLRSTKHCHA